MAISVSDLKAEAKCPSSAVKVKVNSAIKGVHSGKIKNNGLASVSGNIVLSIRDTEGHSNKQNVPFDVDAGQTTKFSYETHLMVNYDTAGNKVLTAVTTVSAGTDKSATGTCTVRVTAA